MDRNSPHQAEINTGQHFKVSKAQKHSQILNLFVGGDTLSMYVSLSTLKQPYPWTVGV